MPSKTPRVAVLVETSTTWGVKVVEGVAAFGHEHGHWSIFVESRGVDERLRIPPWWRGEGIIARVTTQNLVREVRAQGVPCVNVSWSDVPGSGLPQVIPDEEAVGRLAAEHLFDRGFRRFAYVGLPDQPHYHDRCGPAFAKALEGRGAFCAVYRPGPEAARRRRPAGGDDLAGWLRSLPKPVGVLAWDSARGRRMAEACLNAGLRVPEEVGVLGGYNDNLMCEIAAPPLSCVDHSPERIGYEAAALLDRMMAGAPAPSRPVLIQPAGVTARRSTDALVVDDRVVADAMRFIRRHVHEPIGVDDVLRATAVSRRVLEQRFARVLGRSPAAEIRRARVEHAMGLLARTDLPIARVAAASGFNYTEVMSRVFQRSVGLTPTAYRRQFRPCPEARAPGRENGGP